MNVMDKIWYRNPSKSEVIGRCGGDEKTNDHAEPTKSRTLIKKNKKIKNKKNININTQTTGRIIDDFNSQRPPVKKYVL